MCFDVMEALDCARLAARVVWCIAPWCAWGDSLKYVWLNSMNPFDRLARLVSEHVDFGFRSKP